MRALQEALVSNVSSIAASRAEISPALEFRNVTFAYGTSSAKVLSDLSFCVQEHHFVVIVGPSGCGKTTLLRLAGGLLTPSSGEILFAGGVLRGPSSQIGMVFQQDYLLPWRRTVKNIELGVEGRVSKDEMRKRSQELLRVVGLQGAEHRFPHELSGGMRQRVNLARALAIKPRMLLMDEPFASIDAQTREQQQEHLLQVWQQEQKAVVFITHDINEAVFLADEVLILGRHGKGVVGRHRIELPRPRKLEHQATEAFIRMSQTIRRQIIDA